MQLGKRYLDKPILSITDARIIGVIKDLYLDRNLERVTGIYLGSEGFFSKKTKYIRHENVYLYGRDVILVIAPDVIATAAEKAQEFKSWIRRDQLKGRQVYSPSETRIGKIGDVILDKRGQVLGFELAETYITGPVAENQAIKRDVMVESGDSNQPMIVDLIKAEQQKWFFGSS